MFSALWADVLVAMDRAWWHQYGRQVKEQFAGRCVAPLRGIHGVQRIAPVPYHNSGALAVVHALALGASRVVLLGYDCSYGPKGERHHHGDHPDGLGNAGAVADWPAQFAALARAPRDAEIINASRQTALTCFKRMTLEEALQC